MKWFIRRVVKKGKGSVSYEEEIHFGETLTIGRAANQAIFVNDLRAALEHALVVALGDGRFRVESLVAAGLRIDGNFEQTAVATTGSSIEVGNARITIVEPPKDFEAAVEVALIDKSEVASREQAEALPQTLGEAGMSKRRPAWILLLIALTVGLAIPIIAHYVPTFRSLTKDIPGFGLSTWDTGALAGAHHALAKDCQACHGAPFAVVQDDKCLTCHAATPAHADPKQFPLDELASARCAHCHRDHGGGDGLVRADQELCSHCHKNLSEQLKGDTKIGDVGDFGTSHPQFQVMLPTWDAKGKFTPLRTSMDGAALVETSGLKFPHATHLRERGLQSPTGVRHLECVTCHTPEPGGALIAPIDFEQHCQSCHTLGFDVRIPDRQVPHGKVAEVQYMLDEFYSKIALEGGYDDPQAPATVRQRRRPGQPPMSAPEQREALVWARDRSRQIGDTLFNSRACGVCHAVSKDPAAANGGWLIAPVRVSGKWYDKARFSHAKHTTMKCADCHDAALSQNSADLLIPEISNCRQCHAGERSSDKLKSTCIACHGFHQAPFVSREPAKTSAAQKPEAPAVKPAN